jgi:hypothetical protein
MPVFNIPAPTPVEVPSTSSETPLESTKDSNETEIALAIGEAAGRAEVPFRPTEAMCKLKARLHSRFEPSATATHVSALGLSAIIKLTGSSSVASWAKSHPGFLSWLTSEDWFQEKISWLEYLALNAAEDILLNEDPRAAGAKLQAAKLILELSGKIKTKSVEAQSGVDKSVNSVKNLSDDELVKIINVTKKIS